MLQIFKTNALGVAVPQMGIAKIEIKKLTNRAGVKFNGHYVDATKGIVEAEIPLSPYKLVPLNQVPRKTIQGKQYGDFIAHKEGNDYQITHIPSGLKITTGDKATIDKQAQSLANSEVAKFIPKNLGRIMFGLDLSGYVITPSEFNAAMRKALKV